MPLTVEDHGTGNRIELAPQDHAALSGRIVFTGHGAVVRIGPGCVDAGLRIEAGSGVEIGIGGGCHLGALFVHAAAGSRATVGSHVGLNGLVRLLLHEPARIAIGEGCLIAGDVDITVSDMHPIFDAATGRRINPAEDVTIADRVWIGARCMILKGSTIGPDTVIGAASLVAGDIPAACVAAGNPARVIRTGVRWGWDL